MVNRVLKQHYAALEAAAALAKLVEPLAQDDTAEHLGALVDVVSGLEVPAREDAKDDPLELLRTLDLHGEGLRPFSTRVVFDIGDMLIDDALSPWLVTTVDEEGRVMELAGMAPATSKKRALVLWWRPATTARAWLGSGQEAAPAYSDLGKAMTHVVRLWGAELTAVAFFVEAADAPGLKILRGALSEFSDPADVAAFCEARGGLHDADALTAGDFVRMKKGGAWGVVTRADPVDVVVGGLRAKGMVGEPAAAVKALRDVDRAELDAVWRPAKKTGR